MDYANVDYYYNEYQDQMENDNLMDIHANGLVYRYDASKGNSCYEVMNEDMFEYVYKPKTYSCTSELEFIKPKKYPFQYTTFKKLFEQRPDLEMLYYEINKKLTKIKNEYIYLQQKLCLLECVTKYSSNEIVKENYEELLNLKKELEISMEYYENKMDKIVENVSDFKNSVDGLRNTKKEIEEFEKENPDFNPDMPYEEMIKTTTSTCDMIFYSKMIYKAKKYNTLIEQKTNYENNIQQHINESITLDDISDQLVGYNSSLGKVPAGQWDTFKNPNYEGEGHISGLIGSFEGPQGKETGYDSRKGEEKANYKDPDRSLLKFLSEVTDKDGNILYPLSSFKKGGEYYYHIFGVNDDGSINWDLIDNPRFGCKMLGNYLLVGGDQRFNRERGSKIMTSLGPAITIDCGMIDDLVSDPNHIDISMDEVLFWLKDFSHNQDRSVQSLAGIYDWCTKEDYCGKVDVDYEHMERYYVNNLNELYGENFICIFDRNDFENETSYESQEEFVYKLKY